jgi:cold shock CspA family protein
MVIHEVQRPPTITFRRIPRTEAVEADIRKRLGKLGVYGPSIMAARVLIEPAQRHRHAGNRFHIRIDLTVPGEEIVISHEARLRPAARASAALKTRKQDEPDRSHKYLGLAIREAFALARRRLQDYARADGQEIYFQRSSVLEDAFDNLEVGSRVTFVEERGDKGPQASTVRVIA